MTLRQRVSLAGGQDVSACSTRRRSSSEVLAIGCVPDALRRFLPSYCVIAIIQQEQDEVHGLLLAMARHVHSGLMRTRTAFDSVPSSLAIQIRAQPSWRSLAGSVAVICWADSFQRGSPCAPSSRSTFGAPVLVRSSAWRIRTVLPLCAKPWPEI